MFSKPIFKQSVRSNWKLWLIITLVGSVMLTIFTMSFDPEVFSNFASAAEGTRFSSVLSSITTLLGTMEIFYKMLAILLGIVYVLFTANSLVVSEVDSGSLAYTLSTPIKRSSVIFTKITYMVTSIVLMFAIIGGVGLGVTQIKYHNVTGYAVTEDVRQAAKALDKNERYISEHLYLIKDDDDALREAAQARHMDTEAYTQYLNGVIKDRSYEAAADALTDEREDEHGDDDDWSDKKIEITKKEVEKNPGLVLESSDALKDGAEVMGMSVNDYQDFITKQAEAVKATPTTQAQTISPTSSALLLQTAIDATSKSLNMDSDKIEDNMSLIKNPTALAAAAQATNLAPEQVSAMADAAMITSAKAVDKSLDFDTEAYLWLVAGVILLNLALGSISFFASTFFNRTGAAMALGGGLPFAFFLISIIQQQVDNMDNLKYFTITTFYDSAAIVAGDEFGWGLLALGIIAAVLYSASGVIFCKKDLPL